MVLSISRRSLIKKSKLITRLLVLAVIIIYILPQLLSLLVNAFEGDTQERERRLIEKPLRVENSLQKITAFS